MANLLLMLHVVKHNPYRRFAGKKMGINFTGSRYCICSASSHFFNILDSNDASYIFPRGAEVLPLQYSSLTTYLTGAILFMKSETLKKRRRHAF